MIQNASLWGAAVIAILLSASFVWLVRLPLPFAGFSIVAAAGLAGLFTAMLISWMPRAWVWTEAERLRLAFQARHGLSDAAASGALAAITKTHDRANRLRKSSASMRDDVAETVHAIADRMDAAAREIFYAPERHRSLRAVLIRSELIDDAAKAHAALMRRGHGATEDTSRQKLLSAIGSLEAAFDQTDFLAARGLLAQVEVASDVAETVLKPRRTLTDARQSTPSH